MQESVAVIFLPRGNYSGGHKEIKIPRTHDFFTRSEICVVPNLIGIPLYIMKKYNWNGNEDITNNSAATRMMIYPHDGFSEDKAGFDTLADCILGRIDGIDFTNDEFEIVWDYIDHILDLFGDIVQPDKSKFTQKYFINRLYHINILRTTSNRQQELELYKNIKLSGKNYFENKKFYMSYIYYNRCLIMLESNNYEAFSNSLKDEFTTIFLNLAQNLNNMNLFQETLNLLNENENFITKNIKFYFRRFVAYANLNNYLKADDDFGEILSMLKSPKEELSLLLPIYEKCQNQYILSSIPNFPYPEYIDLLKSNTKAMPNFRNERFTPDIYNLCKKIYYLIGTENESQIRVIFQGIYEKNILPGFKMLQICYYNIFNNDYLRRDYHLFNMVKEKLQKYLEGIGGWQN